MRYANHKSHNEHNTYSQVWNINGNLKILLFAAQKIQPMNELFFDYGYNISEIKYQWLQEYEKKFKKSKSSKLKHYN
jgi:SET domain